MPAFVTMTDRQHVDARLVLLDADEQEVPTLPAGASVSFVSSNPAVASFTPDSSQLGGDVHSGEIGTCTITGEVVLPGGRTVMDTLDVTITPSEIVSARFEVGTPVDE